jgi:hypothetical protein
LVDAAHALGGKGNGFDDLCVAGAAADIGGNGLTISARLGAGLPSSSAWAVRIMAGVQ